MVVCPYCNENGIGLLAKLWSDSACPTICRLCGHPSYLRTGLMHWTGASLQLLGLIAIIASLFFNHWWPVLLFLLAVMSAYSYIGLLSDLELISKAQVTVTKRYGNISLLVVVIVAIIVASISI